MNIKKQLPFYILISFIFCVLYIIIAVKPLGTEFQFTPEWKIDVTNPTISEYQDGDEYLPFKLGQSLGYFSQSGKVLNFVTFSQKASISRDYYVCYKNNNTEAIFYTPDATKAGTISIPGFPMFDEERLTVFLPGGSSFEYCNSDGTKKWEYGGTVPITAFDSSKGGIVVGFADGNICAFNLQGSQTQRFAPGGSDYPVILGVAISSSGEYIASVSGQNKQRFVLAKKDGAQTKITAHEFIQEDSPEQRLVKFSADDSTVYFTSLNDIGIADVKSGHIAHLKIKGQAIALQESQKSVFLLTKEHDQYTVYIIEKFATLTGSFSYKAQNSFILADKDCLYVGKDSTISCLKISKE